MMNEINISANWSCENYNKLTNLVTFIESDNQKCELEYITPETCICLSKGESFDLKPELKLKLDSSTIKEVTIFSEASLIEVFGVHNEYLFTCWPEFVDEWEGMSVYQANISLPSINACSFKFTRIKDNNQMWLYSIQLSRTKQQISSENSSLFNMDNVNKLINNSSQEVSEKAMRFKKFFESYTSSQNSKILNMQMLIKVLGNECFDPKTLSNILSRSEKDKKDEKPNMKTSVECFDVKSYIDGKFEEMKEDLMKLMESKLKQYSKETNNKLDHIIKLLEAKK